MRTLPALAALLALAACGALTTRETYVCPNGPTLAVTYTQAGATITFPDGRTELLPPTDTPDVYARAGMSWNAAAFRSARLEDNGQSWGCDQMAG